MSKELPQEKIEEIKSFCGENSISILTRPLGFSCVKIEPNSKTKVDRFFSFSLLNHPTRFNWGISVWSSTNGRRKLHLYMEDSSGVDVMDGLKMAWRVFRSI